MPYVFTQLQLKVVVSNINKTTSDDSDRNIANVKVCRKFSSESEMGYLQNCKPESTKQII